jgi:hypothetical protein
MLEALKGLSERRVAAVKAFQEEAQKVVQPTLQEFMRAHPAIKAVGWTQYTPYFNDGDACVFSVHGLYASTKDERDDSLYDDATWDEVYSYKGATIPEGLSETDWKDLNELSEALSGMEDELEAIFGDHVKVIVTTEGVEVEEYEHD